MTDKPPTLRAALAELVRQVQISNAVDDHGHALCNLKALADARAALAAAEAEDGSTKAAKRCHDALVAFFNTPEGYGAFGWHGDQMGWHPEQTAIDAMRRFIEEKRSAAEAEEGWRPINEAPQIKWGEPGFCALVWSAQFGVRDGIIGNSHGHIFANVGNLHGNAVDHWGVTHFRPLPPPPAGSEPR